MAARAAADRKGGMTGTASMKIRVESEVLGANLAVLGARNPRAARAIAEAEPLTEIRWHECDDGALSAKLGPRWLASRRRPLDEARRFAEGVDIEAHGCVCVFGFGLGHHIAALAERGGTDLVIVVFEPDVRLLRTALERIDLSAALAAGMVVLATDAEDGATLGAALRGAEAFITLGTEYAHHPPSVERLGESSKAFTRAFVKCVSATRTLISTTLMQCDVTARNQLMNADRYATCEGIDALRDAAKGRLGVVVSAGPSLKRNLDLLGEPGVRERCAIVAVQTVLKPMLAKGIRPHFITALDYHEVSRRFYEGLTAEDVEGVTLIVEPKANAAILEAWPGAVRVVGDAFLDRTLGEKLAGERDRLKAGATVAHLAYYVARHLGCDPVALIGQDLAFTDGQYYAKGASIHETWGCELNVFNTLEMMEWQRIVRFRGHLHKMEDHLGRPVFTDEQMATYLAQFETDFLEDTERGLTVIDATEGGVRKAHTELRTLAETLETFAPEGGEPIRFPEPVTSDDGTTLSRLRDRLRKLARECERISAYSEQTVGLLERMKGTGEDRDAINALVDKVHALRDKAQRHETAMATVQQLSQTAMFKRFKADRRLRLAEGLSELEAHARRVERDIANVGWIGEVGEYVAMLLETAAEATKGGAKLTRDLPLDEKAGVLREHRGTLPAVVYAPMRASTLGTSRDLTEPRSGTPVLRRTIDRLVRCERVSRVVVLTDDVESAHRAVGDDIDATFVPFEGAEIPRGLRSSRLFASTCWRGGIGSVSAFDEYVHPELAIAAFDGVDATHALFVGGDWDGLDADLCDGVIARHLESPAAHGFVFTPADVGLAGVVISRDHIEHLLELRRNGDSGGLVGASLGYNASRPMTDPVTRSWCVSVDLAQRRGEARVTAFDRDPIHITLELVARDGAVMDDSLARAVIDSLDPTARPVALSFAGDGDPMSHDRLLTLIRHAKSRGIGAVHVRTDLLTGREEDLRELLASGVDVVSVDLGASEEETYRMLRGHDGFDRAVSNTEWLIHNRTKTLGVPDVWIVPRITRRDEVYDEIERFYDGWLFVGGHPVIDPLPEPVDGARIDALGKPAHAERRDRATSLFVRASGDIPVNERDASSEIVGNANAGSIHELHAKLVEARATIPCAGPDDLVTR
ncbi:MAG: DUF115 domain-containing protein [Phycisphaerales bacterium]